jgi:L-asparaginase
VSQLLVATGGTIASKVQPDGGVAVSLDGRELIDSVDDLETGDIDVLDLFQGPSWNLDLAAMSAIAAAARDNDADGVVITHGTDTLEETAYFVDLVAGASTDRRPIVVTGSMRNAGEPQGDGPKNLRDAFAVTGAAGAAGRGVLVVADGAVHSARWVTKTDTQAVDTFRSPGHEPVGAVNGDRVSFTGTARRGASAPVDLLATRLIEGPIAIVASHADADSALIDWHLDRGARGIVVEGTGAGNVNAALVPGIGHARDRGVPVVVTSRCLTGSVAPIYGGAGGGHSIAELGVVPGGDLSSRKARLALAVGLALEPDIAMRDWFASLVG